MKKKAILCSLALFAILFCSACGTQNDYHDATADDTSSSLNNYITISPSLEKESPTPSPSSSQEDKQNSSYPEVSYKDIKSGKYDESYVIITGVVDSFEYTYDKLFDSETCSFDLWIKDGNSYFKDFDWDILDCSESNLTALKNAKSGNKVKLCVYIYADSGFGSADVIGGEIADNKDHRKSIKKNIIKNCKSIAYKNLLRRPEKYMRKLVKVSGKILQIAEEDDTETEFLLTDDGGNTYYINYELPESDYHLLEDDKISVYGEICKPYTYKNLLGSKKTVPQLDAYYVR